MVAKLITLGAIVLGVIAIAQLMRVYELSSKLRNTGEHEVSNADNRLNAKLMILFMVFLFGGLIWLMMHYGWTGRGDSASVHGMELDWILNLNFVLILAIYFFTNALLFVFAYKYVKKPGVPAFYYPHNNKLEMLWTVVPSIVLAVIIIIGLKGWTNATSAASEESIKVELFSKQFDWTARYAGADNKLGKFDYKLTVDDNNPLALMTTATIDTSIRRMEAEMEALEAELNDENIMLVPKDREAKATDLSRKERLIRLLHQMKARHDKSKDRNAIDASAWDDIVQKDTLYLCVDQEYEFNFRSKDVIHSAYFPHFRAQMNTVPGMTTRFKFTPNKTTAEMRVEKNLEDFNYILMCNKICGGAHYKMKMMVVVLEKKDYDNWMMSKANATFKDGYFAAAAVEEAPADNDENPTEGDLPVEGAEVEEEPVAPVE